MKKYIGYHGTDMSRAKHILKQGLNSYQSRKSLPRDLGRGVYFFTSRHENDIPHIRAAAYVKKFKHDYIQPVVLKALIETENDKILNLNTAENQQYLIFFRENNYELISEELKKYEKNRPAFRRGNFDGVVIEVMIRTSNIPVDIIIKDSFTPIESVDEYHKSNFPNCRELCVKNLKIIKKVCIENQDVLTLITKR